MSRGPLSPAKVGECAVAMAFAAIDAGADPDAIVDAWPRLGAAMPLALGLAKNAIDARGPMSDEMREKIRALMEGNQPCLD